MYRTVDFSYTQCGPNRSRIHYNVSASAFQPTHEDIKLEQAIEDFVAISLGGRPSIGSRASTCGGPHGASEQRGSPSSSHRRVQEAFYPGTYSGSIAGGADSAMSRCPDQNRIGYSRSLTAPLLMRSSASQRRGHSRQNGSGYRDLPESGALVRYSKPREEALYYAMSIGPEDSVSQVSLRAPSRDDYIPRRERRGRTRRREDERLTLSSIAAVPTSGLSRSGRPDGLYDVEEQREPEYYTRDITPWQ
ncbi:hypothetical protein DOTSEDRAFT_30315 [Dothistroma septosporum NZE10]|uniref:Uncharacterized protein n=1 Tax=Dothistroma septosporum (strain NZE10 / CBS 128990) TaxID=675120 RepID=N1PZW9_DOTSN|nr:hypothetical protein DOTSEDRAFT_30315 [Dothistroma septosporum NZE10]